MNIAATLRTQRALWGALLMSIGIDVFLISSGTLKAPPALDARRAPGWSIFAYKGGAACFP